MAINPLLLNVKPISEITTVDNPTNGHLLFYDGGDELKKVDIVEFQSLIGGSRSQQLSLSCLFRINSGGVANKIDVTYGQLFSQTLYKIWNVSSLVTTIADNDYRYVYVKASKTTTIASIYLSKDEIQYDSGPNDFYFLIGFLHSVVDGVRVLSLTIGTTTISGGLIKTGIISSLDGQTTFNLNTGEIKGKITFSSGSSGYENLTDKPDLSSFEATRDYVNTTLQTDLDDLKNRADGVIESWFYSHTPTLSNLPASNWTTTEEKNAHIGDTFTNMQEFVDNVTTPDAGKAWRFVKNETTGEFSWSLIANSDSTKALIEAGKAKDTADAKRRVFVSQPYPPYNIGDLWVQGNGGDIMRCKFERLSGSYVATDFEKASKYTDDTAVNNLQIGGRNLLKNSDFQENINFWNPNGTGEVLTWSSSEKAIDIQNGGTGGAFFQNVNYEAAQYTISFDVKPYFQSGVPPWVIRVWAGGNYKDIEIHSTNEYKRYSFVTTVINAGLSTFVIQPFNGDQRLYFKKIKLEKGNKATDWTPAPEDVDAAISTAQNSANTANSLLADISSDSVLSPSEKQSTKKEWDIIVSEKNTVETQATSLGVSATLYNSAYNSLDTYITPLLSNLTTNSTIDGATFRAKFKAYYDAKISLLKDVTDKLKSNIELVNDEITAEAQKIIALEGKTNFLGSTTIDGNVVATGTLLVGNESGANGGLTGVGGANDIFLWGGSTFANRANAEVWFKRNGHFRLKTATGLEMDSQTGNIVVRHTNGQVGIKIGLDGSNPIMQFFKNTGEKVYELGQNGIYYVSEIAESYTLWRLLNLNSNASTSDFSIFHLTIRSNMWQKMSNLVQFELRGNKDSYLYEAGQNQYSQSNEQYEGYKNTQSKYDNLADGWYAMERLGDMETDGVNETQKIVSLMRIQGGKVVQSGATSVETNGYTFNQF